MESKTKEEKALEEITDLFVGWSLVSLSQLERRIVNVLQATEIVLIDEHGNIDKQTRS